MLLKPIIFILMFVTVVSVVDATTYYVCPNGSDSNDGNISTPYKSITKVNAVPLVAGDSMLFCSGGRWDMLYEGVSAISDKNGNTSGNITYGAYGSGAKPIITRAIHANSTGNWTDKGGNIWATSFTINDDVGLLIFNNDTSYGLKQSTLTSLDTQGEFFYNSTDDNTYLYSTSNPASYYTQIELSKKGNIFDLYPSAHHIVIRGLDLRYSAKDAVYIGMGADYIYALDNSVSWIGGAYQSGTLRYGNCMEVIGGSSVNSTYIYFYNNTVNQCYDAGLSWQADTGVIADFRYMLFSYNVVTKTRYCYEYFNHNSSSTSIDLVFDHNTCINSGGGFGGTSNGKNVRTGAQRGTTSGINVTNNIFYNSTIYGIEFNDVFPATGFYYNNNLYFEDSTSDILVYWKGIENYVYTPAKFVEYQSERSQDLNSEIGDPLFNYVTYQPTFNSPACDLSQTSNYVGALPCETQTIAQTNLYIKISNSNLNIRDMKVRI
jgi:hypothetical protein